MMMKPSYGVTDEAVCYCTEVTTRLSPLFGAARASPEVPGGFRAPSIYMGTP